MQSSNSSSIERSGESGARVRIGPLVLRLIFFFKFFRFRHVPIVEPAGALLTLMMMTMSDSSSSILKASGVKLKEKKRK